MTGYGESDLVDFGESGGEVQDFPAVDAAHVVQFGDGQKGELSAHKSDFSKSLLRCCARHREADLVKKGTAGKVAARVYQELIHIRSADKVRSALSQLEKVNKIAHKLICAVPLERQFPAVAVEAGYGPTFGITTSNHSEIAWTVYRDCRKEKDPFLQLQMAAGIMQKRHQAALTELLRLERRGDTMTPYMAKVMGPRLIIADTYEVSLCSNKSGREWGKSGIASVRVASVKHGLRHAHQKARGTDQR